MFKIAKCTLPVRKTPDKVFWGDFKNTFTEKENSFKTVGLRVAPHLSSWIVERAKRERS